jgi:hypothetical protein
MKLATTTYKIDNDVLELAKQQSQDKLKEPSPAFTKQKLRRPKTTHLISRELSAKRLKKLAQLRKDDSGLEVKPNDNVFQLMLKSEVKYSSSKLRKCYWHW